MPLPIADIALTYVGGLGLRHRSSLVELCGGSEAYFDASEGELRDLGLAPHLITGRETALKQAHATAHICNECGVRVLGKSCADYPPLLAQCVDAPTVLFCRGDLDFTTIKTLAVIGTRRITFEGDILCRRMVGDLLDGVSDLVIVSGLALGVDAAAHRATVERKRATVAVMPGWVDDIAPSSHYGLARDILSAGGAVVSEQGPGSNVVPQSFVIRNRIVAGLSSGTLVVQSAVRGGSMITAEMTLGYDRELFTVAGNGSDDFAGNRKLIKASQAQLVDSAAELADTLGWGFSLCGAPRAVEALSDDLLGLYGALPDHVGVTIDEIAELLDMPMGQVSAMLLQLEVAGYVRSSKGRQIRKLSIF